VMPLLDKAVSSLSHVAEMIANRSTCDRLLESCFSSDIGLVFHSKFRAFNGKVYRARWGTIAFCCKSLLELKRTLCWGWNMGKYSAASNIGRESSSTAVHIDLINQAITSEFWWSAIATLDSLYELIRCAFGWAEGCPCHSHLDLSQVSPSIKKRWQSCPLRGLRLPEVAAGDFFIMFDDLQRRSVAELLLSFPAHFAESSRGELLQEFERGRAHLIYTFTLKLSGFSTPPLLLFASAHHLKVVSQEAVRKCLASPDAHPRIRRLQSEPCKSQALSYLEDYELELLPDLEIFIAELRFAHGFERQIEGGHAVIQRRAAGARHRGEAWDSLALRMPELKRALEVDAHFLEHLAVFLQKARNPKMLVESLGLKEHPALSECK
jgi:hypothetical protein